MGLEIISQPVFQPVVMPSSTYLEELGGSGRELQVAQSIGTRTVDTVESLILYVAEEYTDRATCPEFSARISARSFVHRVAVWEGPVAVSGRRAVASAPSRHAPAGRLQSECGVLTAISALRLLLSLLWPAVIEQHQKLLDQMTADGMPLQ
jgi:hypothetical protein